MLDIWSNLLLIIVSIILDVYYGRLFRRSALNRNGHMMAYAFVCGALWAYILYESAVSLKALL